MKSFFLLALQLLAASEALPDASPQNGIFSQLNPFQRACECGKEFVPSPCTGSFCECRNKATLECWSTRAGACSVALQTCPGPSTLAQDFPACGRGLPGCAPGKVCRRADYQCDERAGGCLGFCVPPPPKPAPPPPKQQAAPKQQPQPKQQGGNNGFKNPFNPLNWLPNAPPAASANGQKVPVCPQAQGQSCSAQQQVCVQDPHDTLGPLRGTTAFKCTAAMGICGGFENKQCKEGQLCVSDPRLQCLGQGCTGLCA